MGKEAQSFRKDTVTWKGVRLHTVAWRGTLLVDGCGVDKMQLLTAFVALAAGTPSA